MTAPASPLSVLVGRDRELGILRERLAATSAGHGGLVLIGGEAGIGKSALAEALCREAAEREALVLVGRCYDLTETPPYGPWIELFAHYRPRDNLPPLPEAFAQRGTVGEMPSRPALFQQALDFFIALSTTRPLVLLLEDLHWADPASLDLLRPLARTSTDHPLLVAITYRSDELAVPHPLGLLLPVLVREASAIRLDLNRLAIDDLQAWVSGRYTLTDADAQRLVAHLYRRADGNPFLTGELLHVLDEERVIQRAAEGWQIGDLAGASIPSLVRQLIGRRLMRFDADARRLLAVAALIGHNVPLDLWESVGETNEEALFLVLEHATAAHLLHASPDGTRAQFVHALIREALYDSVLPPRRRRMHRQVGETLMGQVNPDADAVAYHFREAGDARAAEWLIRAGERADAAYAYETAMARFEEALPLLADDPARTIARAEVRLRLARLRRFVPRGVEDAREANRLASEMGDGALAAAAHFRLGYNLSMVEHVREGIVAMEIAMPTLDALPEAVPDRVARLDRLAATRWNRLAVYAGRLAGVGRYAEAERHANAALAEGERMANAVPPDARVALSYAYPALGRVAEARAMFAANRAHWSTLRDFNALVLTIFAELHLVAIPYQADQPSMQEALIDAGQAAIEHATEPLVGLPPAATQSRLFYLRGRWDEMCPIPRGAMWLWHDNEVALGAVALARGEVSTGWEIVDRLIPDGPATAPGAMFHRTTIAGQRLAADLALATGDFTTALAWLEAHDRWLAWSGAAIGRSEDAQLRARYHRAAGNAAQAHEHAERALADATEPRQPLALLAAHRLLGELDTDAGRSDDAKRHLDAALALADACDAPYERALALLAQAELCAATSRRDAARAALDEARLVFSTLGARPALARADAVAARLAAEKDIPPAYPAGLTAREVEVLRLLAAGRSNRVIADTLFLSEHTVHVHVRNILTKTRTDNRAAATAFAFRHGLA